MEGTTKIDWSNRDNTFIIDGLSGELSGEGEDITYYNGDDIDTIATTEANSLWQNICSSIKENYSIIIIVLIVIFIIALLIFRRKGD